MRLTVPVSAWFLAAFMMKPAVYPFFASPCTASPVGLRPSGGHARRRVLRRRAGGSGWRFGGAWDNETNGVLISYLLA